MVTEKYMKILSPIKYEYGNLKIGGGAFVTGITFHPTDSRTLYIRTDIGAFIAMTLINKLGSIWQTKLPQTTLHRPIPLQ